MQLTARDYRLIRERVQARVHGTPQYQEIKDRQVDGAFRRWLASFDFEFFARFYFPHHFTHPPAFFQRLTYRDLESMLQTPGRVYSVIAWPRGYGKTTTCTMAAPAWLAYNHRRECILNVSDSSEQAVMQLGNLKEEIENNERLEEDYGPLKGKERWQEADIILKNGVRVFALGARMSVRGRKHRQYRPDFVVVDDLEKLKTVQSPSQRRDLERWFTRSLLKAGGFDTKFLVVGNMIHPECLLYKMSVSPAFRSKVYRAIEQWSEEEDLWNEWKAKFCDLDDPERQEHAYAFFLENQEAMLKGTRPSWPEAYPYYALMVQLVSEGESAFMTEMQNDPADLSQRYFKKIHFYTKRIATDGEILLRPVDSEVETPLSACTLYAATDPALGKSADADERAILICARSPTGRIFVLEADIRVQKPEQTLLDQKRFAQTYKPKKWGIESVQFQAFFAAESARHMRSEVVQLTQRVNKEVRIQSLEADLTNGYILICEEGQEALVKEITDYKPGISGQRDHGLDTLEMCRRLVQLDEHSQGMPDVSIASAHEFDRQSNVLDQWSELSKDMGIFVPPTFV